MGRIGPASTRRGVRSRRSSAIPLRRPAIGPPSPHRRSLNREHETRGSQAMSSRSVVIAERARQNELCDTDWPALDDPLALRRRPLRTADDSSGRRRVDHVCRNALRLSARLRDALGRQRIYAWRRSDLDDALSEANRRLTRNLLASRLAALSGALEHLGPRFDNVLDHPIGSEGRERFAHGAPHGGNFVAEPLR